jgi:predicted Fe-S protein YdhL (DUF1289 family)
MNILDKPISPCTGLCEMQDHKFRVCNLTKEEIIEFGKKWMEWVRYNKGKCENQS